MFGAIAVCALAVALAAFFNTQALRDSVDSNSKSNIRMVEEWNAGVDFLLPKVVALETNQQDIAVYVGLIEGDGETGLFDLECVVVEDDQHPTLLKCNKDFGGEN